MNRNSSLLAIAVLSASLFVFAGCSQQTAGINKAEQATASMSTVEDDLRQSMAQIDATNQSLNMVLAQAQSPNVRSDFSYFSDNVDKMDNTGKELLKHLNQMTARGNAYFKEWEKSGDTFTNPEIQKMNQEQRNQLQHTFAQISQSSPGVKGYLNSYLSNLKQVRTYLSNDLTSPGISAIAPVAESTIAEGENVKTQVQPMLTATAAARQQMSVGAGAAAGGAGQQQNQTVR